MVETCISRRKLMTIMTACAAIPHMVRAEEYVDLNWTDLVPAGQPIVPQMIQELLQHDQAPLSNQQPASMGIRTEWNNQIVRLPGFIVPIDYSGTGVTAFILVPYVGACVHVPPPPANQLVFVTTNVPYEGTGMFEAVNVTGMFGTASMSTQLADVAYALSADQIEPFRL